MADKHQTAIMAILTIFTENIGLNGVTIALYRSIAMHVRDATDTAVSKVWKGYTTLHIKAPKGQCSIKMTTISSGIPSEQVRRSVKARLKMKYSLAFRGCLVRNIALHKAKLAIVPITVITE